MKYLLSGRGYLKSDDKDFQPNAGKPEDFYRISQQLKAKKALKAETLRLLKLKN